ncbi:MAG: transcriptional regulator [Leptolyngbyaceae cyanobacterium]
MLLEAFLHPMNLTQEELAGAIHVPRPSMSELVEGTRGLSPSTESTYCHQRP